MNYLHSRLNMSLIAPILLVIGFFSVSQEVSAQYFGQNKMRYKKLDFKVYETPHFRLHYYLDNEDMIKWFAQESEVWYELHQQVFRDTFIRKNPIILYNNSPEFQQTTTIQGEIGVGTGGVTEAFKTRVVMPVAQINHQTRHVLGHELVHAFQYRVLIEGSDSTRLENIGNIPLWMVEGMAEYFSIGKKDAFTAMWMRDAYLNNDLPSLRDMTENMNRYFPYRFGQAFWSYVGSTYGDTVIMPLFLNTAMHGYEYAIRRVFGYDAQTFSNLWRNSMIEAYRGIPIDTALAPIGRQIINTENGGQMNVSPAISPDGRYVAFLSELDLFSIDLFLADAQTGRIIRKLGSRLTNSDIDEFSFLESAGAFSPDSRRFAFSVFSKGKSKLMIVDVENGRTLSVEAMGDISEFTNIAWAPDGQYVAFSGLKNGHSDIYLYHLGTKELTQLTDDWYSDFQPVFSRDGSSIVFSTDRVALQNQSRGVEIPMNLAVIDLETRKIQNLDLFPGANNLNPQFSGDDRYIYFLSNNDGFRNMYRYEQSSGAVERMTQYFTGISGITEYSPALSLSAQDDVVYSYYRGNGYTIYNAHADEFEPVRVDPQFVDFSAAMLPPPVTLGVDLVNANLRNFNLFQRIDTAEIQAVAYKPNFQLDYLANSGVGMSVGSRYGAGLSSGIQGMFSDILGHNQIFAALAVNGEVYDFGGQVAYINQRSRINWGAAISHIPYMSGFSAFDYRDIGRGVVEPILDTYIIRNFQQQAEVFGAYPFSRHHRFELGGAIARYSYRVDRWWQSYYGGYGGRDRIPNEDASQLGFGNLDAFTIEQTSASFIGDNSVFGLTSPLQGFRYRVGMEQYFGDFNFRAYTIDLRKYNRYKPITLAARAYAYVRAGKDEQSLYSMFLGYPHLIRGYESAGLRNTADGFNLQKMMGSKIAVFNFEVRLPFTGPEKLTAIRSGLLFSDLNLFFDAGLAWSSDTQVKFQSEIKQIGTEDILDQETGDVIGQRPIFENIHIPVYSAGISLRINLFGAMILEPYYAIPFQRSDVRFGTFGLNFAPGW